MNHPVLPPLKRELPSALLLALQSRFGDRVSTSQAMREHHGRDESSYDPYAAGCGGVCADDW
jgi:D-lactate dehydrogenase (cytochrome)